VIIYGAGAVGKVMYETLKKYDVIAECFCDDNPNKTEFCGLPVYRLNEIKQFGSPLFYMSVTDIKDAVRRLDERGFCNWITVVKLLKQFKSDDHYLQYAVDMAAICQEAYYKNNLFIHSVDLIITERCSLKCKDCSNLMQYYDNPKDCDTKEILYSIDKLFESVDEIGEVRVIGGEPFMNKEWNVIVKRLIAEPKLHRVVIYTNGTIIPKNMPKSDKIFVFITDYGELSGNIDTLVSRLNVPYHVSKAGGWTACSDIEWHDRTPEENTQMFKNCCVRNLITLSNRRLYRCPFAANIVRLGKIKDFDSVEITRKQIKTLLNMESMCSCLYCNGRPYGAEEIEPAIQREL